MATTIILDNFIDTNGTPLASHAIAPTNTVSASWSEPSGSVTINAFNKAQNASLAAYGWGVLDSSHADGTISVIVNIATPNEVYLVFRYVDTSNWWALSWNGSDNVVHLYKIVAGSASEPFGSTSKTFSTGTNYALQVVMSGNSIVATIDGGSTLSGSDSFQATATKHGMIGGVTQFASTFDDFTMTIPDVSGGNPWYFYDQMRRQ